MKALVDGDLFCMRTAHGFAGLPLYKATSHLERWVEECCDSIGATDAEIYIQGEGNFRDEIATLKPYKGNRKKEKPHHLEDLREYMVHAMGACEVTGKETDDVLGIRQTEDTLHDTIIVSYDKDLDMIPGQHLDPRNYNRYIVHPDTANYNFFHQVLQGDSADNIPGIKGIGPKRAHKLLRDHMHDILVLRDVVYQEYSKHVRRLIEERDIMEDEEVIIETINLWVEEVASLLWIQRHDCETWHGLFHK